MAFLSRGRNLSGGFRAAALLLALLLASTAAFAQAESLNEEKIKAGLLYNFLKYTDWPPGARQSFNVCLYRANSFGGSLDLLNGRTAQEHKIRVVVISEARQAQSCSLLYLPAGEGSRAAEMLGLAHGGVMTMSDLPGFARQGGMVELAMRDDQRIHIVINRAAAQGSGLRIQPRLLKLAEVLAP